MRSEWWSLEPRSAAYYRAAAARARRLRAEATTLWLKEHLENEIAQLEQIAAEVERASEPAGDAASARAETEAVLELEVVIASYRNSPNALHSLASCKILTGAIEEAIPLEEQAIRLGPRDPFVYSRYLAIGQVHLLQSRVEEGIVWLEKARGSNPASPYPHSWLASAYGLQGDLRRATAELAEANRLLGGKGFSSILYMRAGYWGVPKIRALFEDTYFAGLRKAGMPEE